MRTITLIIIHCSATPEGKDYTVQDIDRWHKARGWKGIGYHYVIYQDGSIHKGRPESQVGAHCLNHNKHSIGICYIGGTREVRDPINHKLLTINPSDTRTEAQKRSLRALFVELKRSYPRALIMGHNVFEPQKACPCFDAAKEYADLQPVSEAGAER